MFLGEIQGFANRTFGRIMQLPLGQALVINAVKTDNMLQELVEEGVAGGVYGGLKQRPEYVRQHLFEVLQAARAAQRGENAGDLNELAHVGGEQAVVHDPLGQVIPLASVLAVYAAAVLCQLIPAAV